MLVFVLLRSFAARFSHAVCVGEIYDLPACGNQRMYQKPSTSFMLKIPFLLYKNSAAITAPEANPLRLCAV